MKQCPECRRHILCQDDACPFCETPLPTTGPFVAGVPIALGLSLAACGPVVSVEGDTDGTDGGLVDTGRTTSGASAESTVTITPMSTTTMAGATDAGTSVTTADSSGDGPIGFYGVPSDFGDPFECDLQAQDCPEGEKCMPWANDGGPVWNATRCSPLDASPGGEGDSCLVEGSGVSGIDDCDIGLSCFLVDADNVGECVQLCSQADPICDDGSDCAIVPGRPDIGYCVVPGLCDPLGTDCGAGEVCAPTVPTVYQCLPDASGAQGAHGDPCVAQNSCDPGNVCILGFWVPGCTEDNCCTVFCDPAAGDLVCPANARGETCVDLGDGVGACMMM